MITSTLNGMNGIKFIFTDFCSDFETCFSLRDTAFASATTVMSFSHYFNCLSSKIVLSIGIYVYRQSIRREAWLIITKPSSYCICVVPTAAEGSRH